MSVMGDVLGYDVDGETEGDMDGDIPGVVGRGRRHRRGGHSMHLAQRPSWRENQLAPGLQGPAEGLVPLPMTPLQNGGVFTATVPSITYQGQLQRPYRAERFLCPPAARNGPSSALPRLLGQFFVGVALQQTEIFGIDLEIIGAPTLFGGRMTMQQAEPGVLIRIPVVLSAGLTTTDTIFASMFFLGRVVH